MFRFYPLRHQHRSCNPLPSYRNPSQSMGLHRPLDLVRSVRLLERRCRAR